MPLIKSKSKAAVSANIKSEIAAGKPQAQAVAAALDTQRRARRADGGSVKDKAALDQDIETYIRSRAGHDKEWYLPESVVGDVPYRYQGVGVHGGIAAGSADLVRRALKSGRPSSAIVPALLGLYNAGYAGHSLYSGRTRPRPDLGPVPVLEDQPYAGGGAVTHGHPGYEDMPYEPGLPERYPSPMPIHDGDELAEYLDTQKQQNRAQDEGAGRLPTTGEWARSKLGFADGGVSDQQSEPRVPGPIDENGQEVLFSNVGAWDARGWGQGNLDLVMAALAAKRGMTPMHILKKRHSADQLPKLGHGRANGGPIGYAGGGWAGEKDEMGMTPSEVAPKAERPRSPVPEWLIQQTEGSRGQQGPGARPEGSDAGRYLANAIGTVGSVAAHATGIPSILGGYNRATKEGSTAWDKTVGVGEAASGLMPWAAPAKIASPLLGTPLRSALTYTGLTAPKSLENQGVVSPAHAGEAQASEAQAGEAQAAEKTKVDPHAKMREALQSLQTQRDEAEAARKDAAARMTANRPTKRALDAKLDWKYFGAEDDEKRAKEALARLDKEIGTARTDLKEAEQGTRTQEEGEYFKERTTEGPYEKAFRIAGEWGSPFLGIALGGVGAYGMGKLTKKLGAGNTKEAEALMRRPGQKEWPERVADLKAYWEKGSPSAGRDWPKFWQKTKPQSPFKSDSSGPPWYTVNRSRDLATSQDLYAPRSKMPEYAMNTGFGLGLAGESAYGYLKAQKAAEDLAAAEKALETDKGPIAVERYERAKHDKLMGDIMFRQGGMEGLLQLGYGTKAIRGAPVPNMTRLNSRAEAERTKIYEHLAKVRGKQAPQGGATPTPPARRRRGQNNQGGGGPGQPNGPATPALLLPGAAAGVEALGGRESQPTLGSTSDDSYNDEGFGRPYATGGEVEAPVKRHHSYFQPRKIGRFAGGPVYQKHHSNFQPRNVGRFAGGPVYPAHRDSGGRSPLPDGWENMPHPGYEKPYSPPATSDPRDIVLDAVSRGALLGGLGAPLGHAIQRHLNPAQRAPQLYNRPLPEEGWVGFKAGGATEGQRTPSVPHTAGPVEGRTGGRADALNMTVEPGAYVIPAHVVSNLPGAEGNTGAGMATLTQHFGPAQRSPMAQGGVGIKISDGEYVLSPEQVAKVGGGDIQHGHRVLDALCRRIQKHAADTIRKLPPPATN